MHNDGQAIYFPILAAPDGGFVGRWRVLLLAFPLPFYSSGKGDGSVVSVEF